MTSQSQTDSHYLLCCRGCVLLIAYFLTTSLGRLAFGMDTLAMLKFEDEFKSVLATESRFTEVSKCERSFVALERFPTGAIQCQSQWSTITALNLNILTGEFERCLYDATTVLNPYLNDTML
jgi:hypothetical protein